MSRYEYADDTVTITTESESTAIEAEWCEDDVAIFCYHELTLAIGDLHRTIIQQRETLGKLKAGILELPLRSCHNCDHQDQPGCKQSKVCLSRSESGYNGWAHANWTPIKPDLCVSSSETKERT